MPVPNYLLDACALIAYYNKEEGTSTVRDILERAENGEFSINIHAVNLIEVYYDRIRVDGPEKADNIIRGIYEEFPITVLETISPGIVSEAARLKAKGKMSFADAILIATARCTGSIVVTCDHVELGPVERDENIPFLWIRPHF